MQTSSFGGVHVDGIVTITRVIRINGDDELLTQILAFRSGTWIHRIRDLLRLRRRCRRKISRKVKLPNDRKYEDADLRTNRKVP